jgi:hypothetical protein
MLENKEIDKNFKFGIRWVSSYDTNGAWKKYLDDEYNDIVFDDLDKNSFHIISIEAKDPVSLAEKFRFIKKEFGAACFCIFNYHGSENSFRFSESNSMNLNAFKSESDRILRFADLILKEGGQILLQGCKQGLPGGFGDVISSPRYKVFAHPDTTGPIIIKFNEMGIKSVIDYDLEEGKMVPFRIIQK